MKKTIMTLVLGIVIGTISSAVLASTYVASKVIFKPSNSNWNVKNVEEAIDDLYKTALEGQNIIVYLDNTMATDFPKKDSKYAFERIECSNGSNATFDTAKWEISISNISTSEAVCNVYFSSQSLMAMIKQNINDEEKLNEMFSTSEKLLEILSITDEDLMVQLLEKQAFRNAIYDNYTVTESVIANSPTILSAMKKTTRYQVISKTGQYKSFYDGKAFVLGFSCAGGSRGNYTVGRFLTTGEYSWNPSSYYASNGLAYKLNRFASSVYINGIRDRSFQWESAMYAAVFKI